MRQGSDFLGVIGGMGPLAAADFLRKIAEQTKADYDQQHVPVILWGDCRIPDRTTAIEGRGPSPLPALIDAAQALVRNGAKAVAIPCNTAHSWATEVQSALPVPLLHIASAVLHEVRADISVPKLGMLATWGTRRMRTYEKQLEGSGVPLIWPSENEQDEVMNAVTLTKAGRFAEAKAVFVDHFDRLVDRGADHVALACTEVPIMLAGYRPDRAIDATEALARYCIRWWYDSQKPQASSAAA